MAEVYSTLHNEAGETLYPQTTVGQVLGLKGELEKINIQIGLNSDASTNLEDGLYTVSFLKSGDKSATLYTKQDNSGNYYFYYANPSKVLSTNDVYKWTKLYDQPGQDGAIYNGLMFRGDGSGNVYIRNLTNGALVQTMTYDKSHLLLPHSNSMSFYTVRSSGQQELQFSWTAGMTYDSNTGASKEGGRAITPKFSLAEYPDLSISVSDCPYLISCYDSNDKYLGQISTEFNGLVVGNGQWLNAGQVVTASTMLGINQNIMYVAVASYNNAVPTSFSIKASGATTAYLYSNIYNTYASSTTDKHIGECCVYKVEYSKNENLGTEQAFTTLEPGSVAGATGEELVYTDGTRYRTGYIQLSSISNSFAVNNTPFYICCYNSSGEYIGRYINSTTSITPGSGTSISAGTTINKSSITSLNSSVSQIRIAFNTENGGTPQLVVDGEVKLMGEGTTSTMSWKNTLVQVLKIGFANNPDLWTPSNETRPYGNFVVDSQNKVLYTYVMYTSKNLIYWHKFKLPEVTQGTSNPTYGVPVYTLHEYDILDSWQTDYQDIIQGCCFYKGRIYTTEGWGGTNSKIRVIDPSTKSQIAVLSIGNNGLTTEPEMIDFYNNKCYYGSASVLYNIDFI